MGEILKLPLINPEDVWVLHGMLEDITITWRSKRNNRRGFPKHRACCFGLVKERFTGVWTESLYTRKYPEIWAEIKRLGSRFPAFTSCYVNRNVVCPRHTDSNNVGQSVIVSFGDYTGCRLMIQGEEYNTDCQPIQFDGSKLEHWNTDDLQGTKYSLVFFAVPFLKLKLF